jgi:hypothetical protein
VAIQFVPCLPPETEKMVIEAVRSAVPAAADVRIQCFAHSDRLGIWMRPIAGADDDAARTTGLQSLDLLAQNENFAAFINSALIRSQAADAFSDVPKRLNGDGEPDSSGPVHLTGLHVTLEAPNRVITTVDGFDERPWPDVDFHIITTDTLTASAGNLQIETNHKLDADTSWLNVLTAIFGALTVFVSGWFVLPTLVFLIQDIVIAGIDAPDTGAGAGSAIGVLPSEIMIQRGLKVVFSYERVEVSEGGIFAGGFFVLAQRSPSAIINGIMQLAVAISEDHTTGSAGERYAVFSKDLRKPLSFAWAADGIVFPPNQQSTRVGFQVQDAEVGQVFQRSVSVQVTDVDGLSAKASDVVQLHIVSDVDDGTQPPICRIHPWLPLCHPHTG